MECRLPGVGVGAGTQTTSLQGTCPDPVPTAPAPRGAWLEVGSTLPSVCSLPEIKGSQHTYLLYLLLVIILPILVFLGLKIHLPWR